MRVLVIGTNGQLGKSIKKVISKVSQKKFFIFVGRDELDLSKEDSINNYFEGNDQFDVIVNCAAYTAVDKAEEEVVLANQVNHIAVKKLANIASDQQAKLIHISTDYVFNGQSDEPYAETDETSPINMYGLTKRAGEQALQDVMPMNAIIIRTSWLYSEYGNNFVKTMIRISKERDEINVVSDQVGSPTYATDLANSILEIINSESYKTMNKATEIYHYSNKGAVSWYGFAKEIFKIAKVRCKVNPITTQQYVLPAKRPRKVLTSKDKIARAFNIKTPEWRESLQACIALLCEVK